jgi:hypothetical protein
VMNNHLVPKAHWFGNGKRQHNRWRVIETSTGKVILESLVIERTPMTVPGCECCNSGGSILVQSGRNMVTIELDGSHSVIPIDADGRFIGWSWLGAK